MKYVVYDKETTLRIDNLNGGPRKCEFDTLGAAKGARTRFIKANPVYVLDDIGITDVGHFYNTIEKKKVVENLMTKEKITISANTPRSCDPSTELYWSM